ncbi:MAG: helix-turn-helix transcriptional regulator [Gammaproteobacteria bacterium]|nr:helix-turn-helix transcriptional regulator [Gammaproteobacteria bacterium]
MPRRERKSAEVIKGDEFARRLCARVKQQRKERGWTLDQLAAASGVSRSRLSQIECGEANPTVAVASRIAQAFSLSLGELVDEPSRRSQIEVVSADDPAYLYRSDSNCHIRTLSPLHMEKDIEIYELRLKRGAALKSAPHFNGTREFLTVQCGAVRVTSNAEQCILKKGFSAHYRADVPHCIENIGRGECIAFLVVTYA